MTLASVPPGFEARRHGSRRAGPAGPRRHGRSTKRVDVGLAQRASGYSPSDAVVLAHGSRPCQLRERGEIARRPMMSPMPISFEGSATSASGARRTRRAEHAGSPLPHGFTCECTGTVTCTSDCRHDGRACDCPCFEDFDRDLPPFHEIDCTPAYCSASCGPEDTADCECIVDYGSCVDGRCVTTPFDPEALPEFCAGFEDGDPDFPRCDYCEE